jgi:hypothetical protein
VVDSKEKECVLKKERRALYCLKVSLGIHLSSSFMAKVFTIPAPPKLGRTIKRERTSDPRYVDGQRLLVEAMKYLAQTDPVANRPAIELISEHVRTRFRMSDSPLA